MKKTILTLIILVAGISMVLGNKLTVKVTSSASINGDKPVSDARVVINNGSSQYSAYTDTSGECVFSDIQTGTYSVSITHSSHFPYSSNSFVNIYEYTATTRTQMLLSNEIWGWVVDEVTGEPIADTNVKVTNGGVQKTFTTSSSGYFYLYGFPEEDGVTTIEFVHRDYLVMSNSAGSYEDLARLYRPSYGSNLNGDAMLTPKVVELSVVNEEITVMEIDTDICRYYTVLVDNENVDAEIIINHENKYKFLFTIKNTGNVPIEAGSKITMTFMANGSQQSVFEAPEKIDPGVELQIETEQLGFDFAGAIFPSIWIDFIAEYYDDRPVKGEKHSNSYLSIPVTSPYLSSKYILTDKAFYLPGEPVTLTCLVTNAAEEAGEVKYGITIRDLNKTQDDPDALVESFVGSKQLAGNDFEYVSHQWVVPEDAESGTYMVLLMTSTTVQEGIEELVEEVNVLTSASLNYFRVSEAPPDVQNTVLQFRYPECNYEVAAVTVSGNPYYVANYYIREEQNYINVDGYQYIPIFWKPFYTIVMDSSGEILGRQDVGTSEAAFTSSYYSELSFVRSAMEGLSEQVLVMKTKIDRLSSAITEVVNSQLTDKQKRKLIWDAISLGANLVEIGATGVKSIDLIDVVKDVIKIGAASTAFGKDVDSFLTGEYLQSSIDFPLSGRDISFSSEPEEGFFLPDSYLSLIRNRNNEYEESAVITTGVIILGCVVIDLIASRFSADLDKEISVLQNIKDMLLWRLNNGSQVLDLVSQQSWLQDIIAFIESCPDYSNLTKAIGWTLDDPMGLSDGKSDDRLSKIFINLVQAAYEYESTYKYWKDIANTEVPQNFSNAIEDFRSVYDQLVSRQINATYRVEDNLEVGESIVQAIRDGIFRVGGYSLLFEDNIDFIYSSNGNLELEVQVLKDGALLTGSEVEVWLMIPEIDYESEFAYDYSSDSFCISRAISSIPLSAKEENYSIVVEVRDDGELRVSGGLLIKVMDTSQYLLITDLIDTTEEERFLFDMLKGFGVVKKLCARDFRSSVEGNVEEVVGSFPVAIVHWTDSSFGYNLGSSSFLSSLKAYIGSGGRVFLSGTAVKLLDLMGITEDRIIIRDLSQRLYIRNIDHPVTDKYIVDQRIDLRSDRYFQGAYLEERLEDGIKYLGESYYYYGSSYYKYSMFETGYGDGRVFALGNASYNEYATLNEPSLRTLVWDIVDYLSVAPGMSSEIQEQGQVGKEVVYTSSFEIRGDEEVYGVTAKLVPMFPDETEVISVKMIDRHGNESFPIASNTYSFGNLLPGDSYTIEWTMKFNRLGYNLVTTEVYYREEPTEGLKKISRSSHIDIVAIPEIETDIYVLGHFLEDIDECEMLRDWLGQVGHRVEIGQGLPLEFTPEIYPVAIVHFTSGSIGELEFGDLSAKLKAYIGSGGRVFLSGTAVKLLDLMGITEDRIIIRDLSQRLYIRNIDHPVTDKYIVDQRIDLRSDRYFQGAYLEERLEDGIKYLGESYYYYGSSYYKYSMFETGYGDGRVFALGNASYNEYATLNEPSLRTLVWDIVDYLSVAPGMSSEIQEQGQVGKEVVYTSSFEIRGDEEVYGVTAKLVPMFPDETEVISVKMIDRHGNESFPIASNTYSFGNLLPGDSYTIEWTMKFNRLGYNLVTTEVYYREEPTEGLKKISRSSHIDIVAIPEIETDIYVLGHFLEDIDECEMLRDWLGQVGHRVEIGQGLPLEFTPEIYPVAIVHFTSGSIGELEFGDLSAKLKAYIGSGGRVFLSGTAVKLLDLMGITEDRIIIRDLSQRLYIRNIDHPVTDKYIVDQRIDLRSDRYFQGAYLEERLEDGIKYLGESYYYYGSSYYKYSMFETGYGDGRVFALGNASYNEYATLNEPSLRTLVWDIVDYLSCREFMIPATPVNLSVTSLSTDTAAFSWEIDESDLRGFEIWRKRDGEAPLLLSNALPAESRSFVDTGLVPGTSYHYSLYAVNLYGKSKPAEIALKTLTIPVLQISLSDYLISEFAFPIFIVNGSGVRTIKIVISPGADWIISDAIISSGFTTFVREIVDGKLTLEVFSESLLTDDATEICVVNAEPSGGAVFEPCPDLSSSRLFDIEGKSINHYTQIDYEVVLRLIGDFNDDGSVDINDLALFVVQYGKQESDLTFDRRYDIGPRTGFSTSPVYSMGELSTETPRSIDIFDLAVLAAMYNKRLNNGILEEIETSEQIDGSGLFRIIGK